MSKLISFNLNAFKTELLAVSRLFKEADAKMAKRFFMTDGYDDFVEFADEQDNEYWVGALNNNRFKVKFFIEHREIAVYYDVTRDDLTFTENKTNSMHVGTHNHDVIIGCTKAVRLCKEYLTEYLPSLQA